MVIHAEADGPGTDGASFWIERKEGRGGNSGTRRYMVAGDGLDSKPIVTRSFPDKGGDFTEDVELLVQGYTGAIFLQDRKVKLTFRTKSGRGCLAFYNSTQAEKDDVHFSGVRITAFRKGPLEVAGALGQREKRMIGPKDEGDTEEPFVDESQLSAQAATPVRSPPRALAAGGKKGVGSSFLGGNTEMTLSTLAPDSPAQGLSINSTVELSTAYTHGSGWTKSQGLGGTLLGATGRRGAPPKAGARAGERSPALVGHRSASEGALRRSGGALCGISPGPSRGVGQGRMARSDGWIALATNPPAGEQDFLRKFDGAPTGGAGASRRGCHDFIPM
jgi:hypothetical protein